jgi:hypothetical protein
MRISERLVLVVAIVTPLVLALFGWPRFVEWLSAPPAQSTPEAAGVTATVVVPRAERQVALAPTPVATRRTSAPVPTVLPTQSSPASGDPRATIAEFYSLVASHDFDAAEELWSSGMRSRFPPSENIVGRFSQTTSVQLRRADVVAEDDASAAVTVDLVETDAHQAERRYAGTWHLVRGPNGWLLDQPELRALP